MVLVFELSILNSCNFRHNLPTFPDRTAHVLRFAQFANGNTCIMRSIITLSKTSYKDIVHSALSLEWSLPETDSSKTFGSPVKKVGPSIFMINDQDFNSKLVASFSLLTKILIVCSSDR